MTDYGASIPLAKLFERTSKKGNLYLAGRIGLAKVVLFTTDEVTLEGLEAEEDQAEAKGHMSATEAVQPAKPPKQP